VLAAERDQLLHAIAHAAELIAAAAGGGAT